MKNQLLFILLFQITISAIGQIQVIKESTSPLEKGTSEKMEVRTFKDGGLMAMYENLTEVKDNVTTTVDFFDKDLEKLKTVKSSLHFQYSPFGEYKDENSLYLLHAKQNLHVLRKFEMDQEVKESHFELAKNLVCLDFVVEDNKLFMAGMMKTNVVFTIYNLNSKELKTLNFSDIFKDGSYFKSLQYFKESKTFGVWFYTLNNAKPIYYFTTINQSGEIVEKAVEFKPMIGNCIFEIGTKKLLNGDYVIFGSFGDKNNDFSRSGQYSAILGANYLSGKVNHFLAPQGFFTCMLSNEEFSDLKLNRLGQLENFESLYTQSQEEKQLGSSLGANLWVSPKAIKFHELIETTSGYLVVGEAFSPTTPIAGEAYFYGYVHTNAFTIFLNKNLEVVESDLFPMRIGHRIQNLKTELEIDFYDNEIQLNYTSDYKIYSRRIKSENSSTTKEGQVEGTIRNGQNSITSELTYWYDGAFINYGYEDYSFVNASGKKERVKSHFIKKFELK